MSNEFYHSFEIGFNFWYIVGPFMVLAMAFFGSFTFGLDIKRLKIQKRPGMILVLKYAAAILDLLFCLLVMSESGRGLFQYIVNHLGKDSVLWAYTIMIFLIIVMAISGYFLFYISGRVGEWAKHGYVLDLRREIKRQAEGQKKLHRRRWSSINELLDDELRDDEAEEIIEKFIENELGEKMAITAWPKKEIKLI